MPFCRASEGVRDKAKDLVKFNNWSLSGDKSRKSGVADLVLVVDLTFKDKRE